MSRLKVWIELSGGFSSIIIFQFNCRLYSEAFDLLLLNLQEMQSGKLNQLGNSALQYSVTYRPT